MATLDLALPWVRLSNSHHPLPTPRSPTPRPSLRRPTASRSPASTGVPSHPQPNAPPLRPCPLPVSLGLHAGSPWPSSQASLGPGITLRSLLLLPCLAGGLGDFLWANGKAGRGGEGTPKINICLPNKYPEGGGAIRASPSGGSSLGNPSLIPVPPLHWRTRDVLTLGKPSGQAWPAPNLQSARASVCRDRIKEGRMECREHMLPPALPPSRPPALRSDTLQIQESQAGLALRSGF